MHLLLVSGLSSTSSAQNVDTLWQERWEGDWTSDWYVEGGTWEVGTPPSSVGPGSAHSGTKCAATVLAGNYSEPVQCWLIRINSFTVPPAAQNPRLRFWHWYSYGDSDTGAVQLRVGSGPWQTIGGTYTASGSRVWSCRSIDLSAFAGMSVQFALRLRSIATGTWGSPDDGSYVDDIAVVTGPIVLNGSEGWETGIGDWDVDDGTWEVGVPATGVGPGSAHTGQKCAATVLNGNYAEPTGTRLTSPVFVIPSSSTNPRLRFWHWYRFADADTGYAQIRVGSGAWQTIGTYVGTGGNVWSYPLIDLTPFKGLVVQLAFRLRSIPTGTWGSPDDGWYIDDIKLEGIEPAGVTLVAPTNFSTNITESPKLVWNRSQGATTYRLQVSKSFDFSNSVIRDTSGLTDTSLTVGPLQNATAYFWHVRSYYSTVAGNWSDTWRFLVGTTSVYDSEAGVPLACALEQNYPNPFNPTTTIVYQLPMKSHVALRVFDILGREVVTLVDEVKGAGSHSVQFDGKGLSSGVYLYRLQADGVVQDKRMVLLQ